MKTLFALLACGFLSSSAQAAFNYDAYCRAYIFGNDAAGKLIIAEIPISRNDTFTHGDLSVYFGVGYPDAVSGKPPTGIINVNVKITTPHASNLTNIYGSHSGSNLLSESFGFDDEGQKVCFGKVVDVYVSCGNTANKAVLDQEFDRLLAPKDPGVVHTLPDCR